MKGIAEAQPPVAMGSSIRSVLKPAFLAYILFSLAAISFLPMLAPSSRTASDSYLFGYSNRAGICLFLFLVAGGVMWTKGNHLTFLPAEQPRSIPIGTLAFSLLVVLFGCTVMYIFAGRYAGFGESYYVIDRAWLLAAGNVPYRDFEFAYGPAFLYGPVLINSIVPLGIANAYYLFWVGNVLLGVCLLFKAVNIVNYPSVEKERIFLLLFFGGVFAIIRMGTNYTFLRFACPLLFVLVIQNQFKKAVGRWGIGAILASVAFTAVLISISPETAVAFAFACIWICLFLREDTTFKRGAKAAALLVAFLALFWSAKSLHILDTLLADGGGAISFPIMMAPHILLYFFAVFVCGYYLYWRIRDRLLNDNTIGLIGYAVPAIAAALGRCDPSHVFWNGLAVFLASMFYLSTYKRVWALYAIAFLVFVVLLPNASEFYLFVPQLRAVRYLNQHPEEQRRDRDIADLFPSYSGGMLAPFGYRPDGFGTYRSARIDYGRFEDLIDVSTPRTVNEKLEEMRQNPAKALVLPYHAGEYCRTNPRKEKHYLSTLFLFPYFGRVAHPESVRDPICDYIRENYRVEQEPSPQTFWYGLWIPKESPRGQE
jgi:hypothetical protein